MKNELTKVEFWFTAGHHVLWTKEGRTWNITIYLHECDPLYFQGIYHKPNERTSLQCIEKFDTHKRDRK